MLTGTGFHEKTASTEWSYSINYGPEGEDHYANLMAPGGAYVSNIRTHHAKAIAEGMNALAAKDAEIAALKADLLARAEQANLWAGRCGEQHSQIGTLRESLSQIAEMANWQIGVPSDTEAANEHARIAASMGEVARAALKEKTDV